MKKEMTKHQVRMRHRKELEAKGIKIGYNHVVGAKAKHGDMRVGKCMVCGELVVDCTCDGRSDWWKKRYSAGG